MNSNTELSLTNTSANAGTITLPLISSIPGRVVSFKDTVGTYGRNNLTLQTSGSDTFEDGGTRKVLRDTYGSIQLVGSNGKWYILNGTQVNTLQVSTLNTNAISSISISTLNTYISTLSFIDTRQSTNLLYTSIASLSTQAVSTNLLYYNGYVIAGTRVGYNTMLNKNSFSPISLPGLSLWLDAADSNTLVRTGLNITQWNDKSVNKYNATSPSGSNPTLNAGGQNGLNTITFNGTSQFFTISNPNALDFGTNDFAIFAAVQFNLNGNLQQVIAKNSPGFPTWKLSLESNLPQITIYNTAANQATSFGVVGSGWGLLSGMVSRSTGNVMFINGTGNIASGIVYGPINNQSNVTIGVSTYLINRFWAADMGEILVYNASFTNFQRQQIEGYLAWKWGLQAGLPASHPFKNAPPS